MGRGCGRTEAFVIEVIKEGGWGGSACAAGVGGEQGGKINSSILRPGIDTRCPRGSRPTARFVLRSKNATTPNRIPGELEDHTNCLNRGIPRHYATTCAGFPSLGRARAFAKSSFCSGEHGAPGAPVVCPCPAPVVQPCQQPRCRPKAELVQPQARLPRAPTP